MAVTDKTSNNDKPDNRDNGASSSAPTPANPNANDLVKAQAEIIRLLADWPPEFQARTLRACAVILGVQLTPRGTGQGQAQQGQQQRSNGQGNNAQGNAQGNNQQRRG